VWALAVFIFQACRSHGTPLQVLLCVASESGPRVKRRILLSEPAALCKSLRDLRFQKSLGQIVPTDIG
jgi:hypothetical protein